MFICGICTRDFEKRVQLNGHMKAHIRGRGVLARFTRRKYYLIDASERRRALWATASPTSSASPPTQTAQPETLAHQEFDYYAAPSEWQKESSERNSELIINEEHNAGGAEVQSNASSSNINQITQRSAVAFVNAVDSSAVKRKKELLSEKQNDLIGAIGAGSSHWSQAQQNAQDLAIQDELFDLDREECVDLEDIYTQSDEIQRPIPDRIYSSIEGVKILSNILLVPARAEQQYNARITPREPAPAEVPYSAGVFDTIPSEAVPNAMPNSATSTVTPVRPTLRHDRCHAGTRKTPLPQSVPLTIPLFRKRQRTEDQQLSTNDDKIKRKMITAQRERILNKFRLKTAEKALQCQRIAALTAREHLTQLKEKGEFERKIQEYELKMTIYKHEKAKFNCAKIFGHESTELMGYEAELIGDN